MRELSGTQNYLSRAASQPHFSAINEPVGKIEKGELEMEALIGLLPAAGLTVREEARAGEGRRQYMYPLRTLVQFFSTLIAVALVYAAIAFWVFLNTGIFE